MPWAVLSSQRFKGKGKQNLWFVAVTWLIMTARFIAGGIEFSIGPVHWAIQPSMVLDYGGAVAAILAVWVARDWSVKRGEASDA